MAIQCPVCKKGTIKKSEKMVYCSEKNYNAKTKKNEGCDFHIFFDQSKIFGDKLDTNDIKKILNGETITSSKGHTMTLNLTNTKFFTKVEFAEKEEDEDL